MCRKMGILHQISTANLHVVRALSLHGEFFGHRDIKEETELCFLSLLFNQWLSSCGRIDWALGKMSNKSRWVVFTSVETAVLEGCSVVVVEDSDLRRRKPQRVRSSSRTSLGRVARN